MRETRQESESVRVFSEGAPRRRSAGDVQDNTNECLTYSIMSRLGRALSGDDDDLKDIFLS